jgi:oxepin-CoA hydrolase/3-oxo-5,6-dehydrosuberyl-CoA semialdehyde dehydrogenase
MFIQFLTKINNLKPETKPQWGKMTAQHMVEHLITAVQISNGKVHFNCFNPPEKLPALRRFFESNPDAKPTNVTFGELNKAEWDQFHKKHFTHHLTQFNLLD